MSNSLAEAQDFCQESYQNSSSRIVLNTSSNNGSKHSFLGSCPPYCLLGTTEKQLNLAIVFQLSWPALPIF